MKLTIFDYQHDVIKCEYSKMDSSIPIFIYILKNLKKLDACNDI